MIPTLLIVQNQQAARRREEERRHNQEQSFRLLRSYPMMLKVWFKKDVEEHLFKNDVRKGVLIAGIVLSESGDYFSVRTDDGDFEDIDKGDVERSEWVSRA